MTKLKPKPAPAYRKPGWKELQTALDMKFENSLIEYPKVTIHFSKYVMSKEEIIDALTEAGYTLQFSDDGESVTAS